MIKKEARCGVLYGRVKTKNLLWIKASMKKLGYNNYTGRSEFLDQLFDQLRNKKQGTVKHKPNTGTTR